jgi:hypothetical protein
MWLSTEDAQAKIFMAEFPPTLKARGRETSRARVFLVHEQRMLPSGNLRMGLTHSHGAANRNTLPQSFTNAAKVQALVKMREQGAEFRLIAASGRPGRRGIGRQLCRKNKAAQKARVYLFSRMSRSESWPLLLVAYRTGWRLFDVFLPGKRSVVRLDAAREIDGKRKQILTPSDIVLHPNIGDPTHLFVTNKIQASIYPIHCSAILLVVVTVNRANGLTSIGRSADRRPSCSPKTTLRGLR